MATLEDYRQQYRDEHDGQDPPSATRGTTDRNLGGTPAGETVYVSNQDSNSVNPVIPLAAGLIVAVIVITALTTYILTTRKTKKH